ncbi:MAG: FtsX-like permease family protein [Thermoproteota archaeon]|jgi:ABC-type lipoprotein release transport system permease subunit
MKNENIEKGRSSEKLNIRIINNVMFVLLVVFLLLSSNFMEMAYSQTNTNIEKKIENEITTSLYDLPNLVSFINDSNIIASVNYLSKLSRLTGTKGAEKAASYIAKKLKEYTPQVYLLNYSVPVPIDYGTNISITTTTSSSTNSNRIFRIYPLAPNLIMSSSTLGITGKIVYVGRGNLSDLNGKPINGSIVVMDFNSGYNWLWAFALGAKAVIFIEPESTTRTECEMKSLNIPVYLPRYYITQEEARDFLQVISNSTSSVEGTIKSHQTLEEGKGINIVAVIDGENKSSVIGVVTFYDGYSVVPSFSYDVDAATNPALLLELARYYSIHRPKNTLMFIAVSGHFQTLKGIRELMDQLLFSSSSSDSNLEILKSYANNLSFLFGLHVSSNSPAFSFTFGNSFSQNIFAPTAPEIYALKLTSSTFVYTLGSFVNSSRLNEQFSDGIPSFPNGLGDKSFSYLLNKVAKDFKVTDRLPPYLVVNSIAPGYEQAGFPNSLSFVALQDYEADVLSSCYLPGVTLRTISSYLNWNLPTGNQMINSKNIRPQAEAALAFLHLIADTDIIRDVQIRKPLFVRKGPTGGIGYPLIRVTVVKWNPANETYIRVPKALVVLFTPMMHSLPYIEFSNENATAEFKGIPPLWGHFVGLFFVEAYKVNYTTGKVIYAPDYGVRGGGAGGSFMQSFQPLEAVTDHYAPVFEASTLVCFGYIDPEFHTSNVQKVEFYDLETMEAITAHSDPANYVSLMTMWPNSKFLPNLPLSVIPFFVPPYTRVVLVFKNPRLAGLLDNSGTGYYLRPGEQINVFAPLEVTKSLILFISHRLNTLNKFGVFSFNKVLEDRQDKINMEFRNYSELLSKYDYALAYYNLINLWVEAYENLGPSNNMFYDVAYSSVFIASFSLFSVFLIGSSLPESFSLQKRLFSIVVLYLVLTIIFAVLHPAYWIVSNPLLLLISLSSIILLIPVLIMLYSRLIHELEVYGREVKGVHESTIDRVSALMLSLGYGIHNVKKHKLRASLMLVSIISGAFSIVALTSSYSYTAIFYSPTQQSINATYVGLYIRSPNWLTSVTSPPELPTGLISAVLHSFPESSLYPRVMLLPYKNTYSSETKGLLTASTIFVNGKLVTVSSDKGIKMVLGLATREPLLGKWNTSKYLVDGRWFSSDSALECIVTQDLATSFNLKVNDTISFLTLPTLKIVGIINSTKIYKDEVKDFDGKDYITPPDYYSASFLDPSSLAQKQQSYLKRMYVDHLNSSFLLVPWKTLYSYGGSVTSIFIDLYGWNFSELKTLALSMTFDTGQEIFACYHNELLRFYRGEAKVSEGIYFVIVPLIIIMLVIISNSLGLITEREREVNTISTLGVAPSQVTFIVLGEIIVYTVLGSFSGFILSLIFSRFFSSFFGLYANFTGSYALIGITISILLVLISSTFTLYRGISKVAPSLETKWKLSRPRGDQWVVSYPIEVKREEIFGFMSFIDEYLKVNEGDVLGIYNLKDSWFESTTEDGIELFKQVVMMNLLPPELSISQKLEIIYSWDASRKMYTVTLIASRLSGSHADWSRRAALLFYSLRSQTLLWTGLREEDKRKYLESKIIFKKQSDSVGG